MPNAHSNQKTRDAKESQRKNILNVTAVESPDLPQLPSNFIMNLAALPLMKTST